MIGWLCGPKAIWLSVYVLVCYIDGWLHVVAFYGWVAGQLCGHEADRDVCGWPRCLAVVVCVASCLDKCSLWLVGCLTSKVAGNMSGWARIGWLCS